MELSYQWYWADNSYSSQKCRNGNHKRQHGQFIPRLQQIHNNAISINLHSIAEWLHKLRLYLLMKYLFSASSHNLEFHNPRRLKTFYMPIPANYSIYPRYTKHLPCGTYLCFPSSIHPKDFSSTIRSMVDQYYCLLVHL